MCNKNEALQILREVYSQCQPVLPITDAYLYGSYARGDYDTESDVDILLISSLPADEIWPRRRKVSSIANDISTDHDVSVSVCVRSKDQFKTSVPLYSNIAKDGIRVQHIIPER